MKNVIILSCSTGQGHNSCAEAIKEAFEKKNITCQIRDALTFISPEFAGFMSWGHSFMYKYIPGLFRWGYRFNEEHPDLLRKGSLFYRVLTSGMERLYRFLREGGFDTVICTHVFPALTMTKLLERYELPVRTAFVATDYTCSPGTESIGLEYFFIPCRQLVDTFDSRIPCRHTTVVSGIPVRSEFWIHRERGEAKELVQIDARNRHLLVMCGSMGCGPIVKLLSRVTREAPADLEVTVICGTNKRLREKLLREYEQNRRVHILGYTEKVSAYMDSADLYLTKPGGISVTEAAAKNLPMVFINPVSGCEKYNMDFFTQMGAAITDTSIDRLAQKCIRLLTSDESLRQMRRALENHGQPNGAEVIYKRLSEGTQT